MVSRNRYPSCQDKGVSIVLQKSIVPWLVAIFGIDYPTQTTADIVRQMVASRALVTRDNVKGLGERFDALVDE